jgi:hypothetical protein
MLSLPSRLLQTKCSNAGIWYGHGYDLLKIYKTDVPTVVAMTSTTANDLAGDYHLFVVYE